MTQGVEADGIVLELTDPLAADPAVAGAKAANLAQAASAGLPVLPGAVLTTAEVPGPEDLRELWDRLSRGGTRALVVRSSSTVEDAGESSMAGQFRSVLGVRSWESFQQAVTDVLASAVRRADPTAPPAPMGVLVQPELDAASGGVLFGVEPVGGDPHRLMVEAVEGGPNDLVSGTVTAARYVISRHGHVLEVAEVALLSHHQLRRLARLARKAERVFGRPQDVEWAFDREGRLWLLQSRPVTATGHRSPAITPILGAGPVSETFPHPLRPLEQDLWVAPLRDGITEALRLTAGVSHKRLRKSPVVTAVGGRIAVDLELLGAAAARHSLVRVLDPRRPARRLVAAWRVGRLRTALPSVAEATIRTTDRHLAAVPALASLSDDQLLVLLERLRPELAALHADEILAGMLLPPDGSGTTAAALALAALAAGRAAGSPDEEIVHRTPVVLSLLPPRIGAPHVLPDAPGAIPAGGDLRDLGWRETLRLRARWVQELGALAAGHLGGRLASAGRLLDAEAVALLKIEELRALVAGAPGPAPDELSARARASAGPPLPPMFRLGAGGEVFAVTDSDHHPGGRAAGGGRGAGVVTHDSPTSDGVVLVVETLSPELAAYLPHLAGLIAETGSTLSHLAILAREYGVPTVVAVPGARQRFPVGATALVDGDTGEVSLIAAPSPSEELQQ
ncbi:MAG TPA: PEP/pyruvate-binding domain-containing protein [Acidimicrobiales bacterium]